jgi:glycosyltransferase involved in cell wall biosynthesis
MTTRVHFHTDNYWFSGSETTLMVLLDAAARDPGIDPVFTYRPWPEYNPGLRAGLPAGIDARALTLPDPESMKLRLIGDGGHARATAVRAAGRALPLRKVSLALDIPRLTALFRETRPDIVHVNNGGFPGAVSCTAAALAARRAGVARVAYVVNNMAEGYDRLGRWSDRPVDRRLVHAVDRFVTGSLAASQALSEVLHLSDAAREVIPNTIVEGSTSERPEETRRRLHLPADVPTALVVARLEKRKGHAVLLDGLARLQEEPWFLVVAGDGPERATLESKTAELGLGDRVRFAGHQSNVWNLFAVAQALVLPSISNEDFPIVILEAMAAGLPVVATKVAGTVEQVVDGVTGRLVPPGDPDVLTAAVLEVIADPDKGRRMGKEGRRRFESCYTPKVVADRYWDLYRRLPANAR